MRDYMNTPKISILTPTIRPGSLDVVKKALDRQTIPYDEWLIGSNFDTGMGTWVKDDFEGGFFTLNRIGNKLIKQAMGELIISVQDFTFFNPEALEKFVFYYEKDKNSIVSGIGDKYESVYPTLGKKVWADPRRGIGGTGFKPCIFHYIESNFCSFPRQALIDIGGYDESMDFMGYGLDSYGLLDRLDITKKYNFYLDETNESYSLPHGRVAEWDSKGITADQYKELHDKYLENPVLSYL
jgi:hypothetical protein